MGNYMVTKINWGGGAEGGIMAVVNFIASFI
jgi:hypothetical protein